MANINEKSIDCRFNETAFREKMQRFMKEGLEEILLERCDEKEKLGIENLYDSDIADIRDIANEQGINVSLGDLYTFFEIYGPKKN